MFVQDNIEEHNNKGGIVEQPNKEVQGAPSSFYMLYDVLLNPNRRRRFRNTIQGFVAAHFKLLGDPICEHRGTVLRWGI
jgi:hypothetical protein